MEARKLTHASRRSCRSAKARCSSRLCSCARADMRCPRNTPTSAATGATIATRYCTASPSIQRRIFDQLAIELASFGTAACETAVRLSSGDRQRIMRTPRSHASLQAAHYGRSQCALTSRPPALDCQDPSPPRGKAERRSAENSARFAGRAELQLGNQPKLPWSSAAFHAWPAGGVRNVPCACPKGRKAQPGLSPRPPYAPSGGFRGALGLFVGPPDPNAVKITPR